MKNKYNELVLSSDRA
jgi:hypothetical protein